MKKAWVTVLAAVAVLQASAAMAANEETSYFSNMSNYWDEVYVTPHYASNGGILFENGNIGVTELPYGMMNDGDIYKICCYNGRIYYMTGPEGSDIPYPVKIYSCDMNGGNNILLADNVAAYGGAFIVDNVLYYQEYVSDFDNGPQGYDGGVTRINLSDLSWKKIVTGCVELKYCDGKYAYYHQYRSGDAYGAVDVNGNYSYNMDKNNDEYQYDVFIKGDSTYYISGNTLYKRQRNGGNARVICSVPSHSGINNVSSNYIFYSQLSRVPGSLNMVAFANRVSR